MAVLDLARLRADTAVFKPKPFPLDAQPSTVADQPRLGALPDSQRPGLVVSARTREQVTESYGLSMAAQYRNGLLLFYCRELPNNRFLFRFYKNAYGSGVVAIPQVKNLLENLSFWEYHDEEHGLGGIITDVVGMIYLKSNFP